MKSLYGRFLTWLANTRLWRWIILKGLGYIENPFMDHGLPGNKFIEGYKFLQPGDMIQTSEKGRAVSFLIKGDFDHAAFCVGKNSTWEISEMVGSGYHKSNFYEICRNADRVRIIRCVDWDRNYVKRMIDRCKSFEGSKYDTAFSFGIKDLYCSEMIYHSDMEKRLKVSLEDIAGLGRKYISPDGLGKARNIKIIWDSKD